MLDPGGHAVGDRAAVTVDPAGATPSEKNAWMVSDSPSGIRQQTKPFRTADGVGNFPQERLSPLPVFKVGKAPPGTASTNTYENKAETFLRPSATVPLALDQDGETEPNRATTGQVETTHQTSPRQVATCLPRNDSRCPGEAFPPTLLSCGSPIHEFAP